MMPVPIPSFMTAFMSAGPEGFRSSLVDRSDEGAYAIGSSPVFVIGDQSSPKLLKPGQPESKAYRVLGSGLFYLGTGGDNGTGIEASNEPLKSAKSTDIPINVVPDWPTKGFQLYVWAHLPTSVKIVTYSYSGTDFNWVTPVKHAAAVLVPRPAVFDGNYGVWNKAPFPEMKAYNARGKLVAAEDAPRIGGDRVPKVRLK
jgi:hypothetical protein